MPLPGTVSAPAPANLSRVIAASGTPVTIYGNGVAHNIASFTIPGNTIAPDSMLEVQVLFGFLTPNNGGRTVTISLGSGNVIGQAFPTATLGGLRSSAAWFVTSDLTAGKDTTNGYTQNNVFGFSVNLNDVLSPSAGQGAPFSAHTNLKAGYKIDLTQAQSFTISAQPVSGDQCEIVGWALINHRTTTSPNGTYAPSTAWAAWGDSLTNGTGASATVSATTGPYPQQIAFSPRVGIPYVNMGVGGDKSADITQRLLADKVRGKYWNVVLDMGRNDVGSAGLTALVTGYLAQCVANLAPGVGYVINTIIPAANEGPGTGNWIAILALNAQINATYGAHVADVFAALTANGTTQINNNLRNITTTATISTGGAAVASGSTSIPLSGTPSLTSGFVDVVADSNNTQLAAQTTFTVSGSTMTVSPALIGSINNGANLNLVGAGEVHLRDAGYAIKATTVKNAMTANGF